MTLHLPSLEHERPFLASLLLAGLLASCGGGSGEGDGGGSGPDTTEAMLRRERTAALVSKQDWGRARAELAPLLASGSPARQDLLVGVQIELGQMDLDAASGLLAQWGELEEADAALEYLRARVAHLRGELDQEVAFLEAALALEPADPATRFALASALNDLDYPTDEAWEASTVRQIELYDGLEELGLANGTIWYVSTIYRRFLLSSDLGDTAAIDRYQRIWEALEDQGAKPASESVLNEGTLAQVGAPAPLGVGPNGSPALPPFAAGDADLPAWRNALQFGAHDLDGDRRVDLVSAGPAGLRIAIREDDGSWTEQVLRAEPTDGFAALDLNRDDDWDLLWWSGQEVGLLEHDETTFVATPLTLPTVAAEVRDAALADYDHDGDLDVILATASGGVLWRNDGAGVLPENEDLPRGTFTEVSGEASLPQGKELTWVTVEDLDDDQDVDLLMGGPEVTWLGSSLRGGRFEDLSAQLAPGLFSAARPAFADWDADGDVDVIVPGSPTSSLWRQGPDRTFAREDLAFAVPAGARLVETDLDLDGYPDLVHGQGGGAHVLLAAGHASRVEATTAGSGAEPSLLAVTDLDVSLDPNLSQELLTLSADGVRTWRAPSGFGNGIRLRWVGKKDNRQAIGAIVHLRAGAIYRRLFWRGDTEVLGLGPHEWADVVRVTWPNGVSDSHLGLERGDMTMVAEAFGVQPEGLIGSCPFLYTWNGERFEFISDVLGITPLGLPMAPGMLVPPDHDEYVLVRGDQLVPRNGVLEMQFTEELREVTYLDRVLLQAVDHPADVEVFPNERFTFPPFPEAHTHTTQDPLTPLSAMGSDGADWTSALAELDDVHAVPFQGYKGQYLGLAEPHFLELAFDPEAVRGAKRLRLICTGWFFWTDASVNMASGRDPSVEFVPPLMMAPTPEGEWAPTGPPLGFPAGKTKTMVVDVTDTFPRDAARIRLFSTLMLYWDRIVLAVDDDDAPLVVTDIEAESARLWERGFSAPIATERADLPERFEFERLSDVPRWDQHPGRYTRLGNVLPLVNSIDDQFVVLGSGDCLTLRFPTEGLPPLQEGWTRDWLVFFDGWAKDRDPNTIEALNVDPLPFHGMSGYPYGPEESFPDTAATRAWRNEWQTRPARRRLAPLAPAAFEDWAASPH